MFKKEKERLMLFEKVEYVCCGVKKYFFVYKQYEIRKEGTEYLVSYICNDGDEDLLGYFNTLEESKEYVKELEYNKKKKIK